MSSCVWNGKHWFIRLVIIVFWETNCVRWTISSIYKVKIFLNLEFKMMKYWKIILWNNSFHEFTNKALFLYRDSSNWSNNFDPFKFTLKSFDQGIKYWHQKSSEIFINLFNFIEFIESSICWTTFEFWTHQKIHHSFMIINISMMYVNQKKLEHYDSWCVKISNSKIQTIES